MAMFDVVDSKSSNYSCESCYANRNKDLVTCQIVGRNDVEFRTTRKDNELLEDFKSEDDFSKETRERYKGCISDRVFPTYKHTIVPNGFHIGVHLQSKGYKTADEIALHCDGRTNEILEENERNLYETESQSIQESELMIEWNESQKENEEDIKEIQRMLDVGEFEIFKKSDLEQELVELNKDLKKVKVHQRRITNAVNRLENVDKTTVYGTLTSLRKSYRALATKWGKREVLNGNQAKNFTRNYLIFAQSWQKYLVDPEVKKWDMIFKTYMRLVKRYTELCMTSRPLSLEDINEIWDLAERIEIHVKKYFTKKITGKNTKAFYASWKYHKAIIHQPEFVTMWGCMGMLDEQSIEKLHQVCNSILRVICNLTGQTKMEQLVRRQRLFNIPSQK